MTTTLQLFGMLQHSVMLGLSGPSLAWQPGTPSSYRTIVVEPMRDVLHDTTFPWTDDAQNHFQQVELLITDSPALALIYPSLLTIVSTDASD